MASCITWSLSQYLTQLHDWMLRVQSAKAKVGKAALVSLLQAQNALQYMLKLNIIVPNN